jgi:hypothetical protein
MDATAKFLRLVWLVGVVAHRPTEGFDPGLHDMRRPLNAVELCTMTEHSYNVSRIFFLVSDELECNTPKHGDANDHEAG